MSSITREKIIEALETVIIPEQKKNVVEAGIISAILIQDNRVGFSIDLPANISTEQGGRIRDACETTVKHITGIEHVTAVLTAEHQPNESIQVRSKAKKAPVSPPTPKPLAGIRHIIAIASGKGGVGKSTIAANTAVMLAKLGHKVGLVDADITGPSVAKIMGNETKPDLKEGQMVPHDQHGVKCLSMGMLLGENAPAIWRGPMVGKALAQLMRGGHWGELDYLVVDFPPGTSDIHLSIAQNFTIDGVVVVSTPQQLSLIDVKKAAEMFAKLNIPIIGVVNNMAYFQADDAGEKHYIFGEDAVSSWCNEQDIAFITDIGLNPDIASTSDSGTPYVVNAPDEKLALWESIAASITAKFE